MSSLGDKLGLSGTPAFVVGDEVISGAVGIEPLRKTVAGRAPVRQGGMLERDGFSPGRRAPFLGRGMSFSESRLRLFGTMPGRAPLPSALAFR